jgi:hypothetical protein
MRIVLIFCVSFLGLCCSKDAIVPVGTGNHYKLSTGEPSNITQTSVLINAVIAGNNTAPGITSKGVCLNIVPNPVVSNLSLSGSTGMGSYNVSFNSLLPGKKYYARAFAVIAYSVALYGNEIEFTTLPVNLATISSSGVSSITRNTAVFSSNVTAAGGGTVTARGICWSTVSPPSLSNSFTINGAGTGSYSATLTGLNPATTYFVRAYATNEAGTAYGPTYSFKTIL